MSSKTTRFSARSTKGQAAQEVEILTHRTAEKALADPKKAATILAYWINNTAQKTTKKKAA